ncbi:MAG TPA: hypothetical protein VGO80_19720 [Solirubrobacteraceae bacterium]|jgi:hypothetical protein|nr:hypothetical protein [Solirubrobacteraceae bacterium]
MASCRSILPRATTTLLALLLGIAAAPARAADNISFSITSYQGGPVLAADGRVVIGERLAGGARRILAIHPENHAFNEIARFPPPADPRTFHVLRLAGNGGIVTATLDTYHDVTGSDAEHASPTLLTSRAYTVLPTLAPLATCDPVRADFPASIRAAGGDAFTALAGDDCGLTAAVRLRNPNATLTVPAEVASSFPPTSISDLRAAGPFATWTETRLDNGPKATFTAVRAATGEILLRRPGVSRYALGSDGTIVTADAGGCTMRVVSLAPLAQRAVSLPAGICPGFFGQIAVAGGRVVYPVLGSYAVSDLQGAAHLVGDLPVESVLPASIAFDGHMLYGVRVRCHDELLLAVDTTVPAAAPLPLTPPPSLLTCPVRRAGAGRVRVASDHRVSIRVRCPSGCRGTLRLVQQRRGRRERRIGSVDFVSTANTFTLRPRIARYARALAGCRGGLRAVAQIHRTNDRTTGLGAYRILSRSSCRRSGGPAFATPRPWPREW